jgi:hypothetical protein
MPAVDQPEKFDMEHLTSSIRHGTAFIELWGDGTTHSCDRGERKCIHRQALTYRLPHLADIVKTLPGAIGFIR